MPSPFTTKHVLTVHTEGFVWADQTLQHWDIEIKELWHQRDKGHCVAFYIYDAEGRLENINGVPVWNY